MLSEGSQAFLGVFRCFEEHRLFSFIRTITVGPTVDQNIFRTWKLVQKAGCLPTKSGATCLYVFTCSSLVVRVPPPPNPNHTNLFSGRHRFFSYPSFTSVDRYVSCPLLFSRSCAEACRSNSYSRRLMLSTPSERTILRRPKQGVATTV